MDLLSENRELLDGYRRGDPEALERVYRGYVRSVAAILRQGFSFSSGGRQLRFDGYQTPEDLGDALQETFLNALGETARLRYDGINPFQGYVNAIARNVVLGRFRRDARRLKHFRPIGPDEAPLDVDEMEVDTAAVALASTFRAPDEAAEAQEVKEVVTDFFAELDDEQQDVVRLHYLERMSQESTAEQLAMNRNRVRKIVTTVKKKLVVRLRHAGLGSLATPTPADEKGTP